MPKETVNVFASGDTKEDAVQAVNDAIEADGYEYWHDRAYAIEWDAKPTIGKGANQYRVTGVKEKRTRPVQSTVDHFLFRKR